MPLKQVALLLLALFGLGLAFVAVRAWLGRLAAASRTRPVDAAPILPDASDEQFRSGVFVGSSPLTPRSAGTAWRGIAIHGPKRALILERGPAHRERDVVIAGFRQLDAGQEARAGRELRLAFTNLATGQRREVLVASAGVAADPLLINPAPMPPGLRRELAARREQASGRDEETGESARQAGTPFAVNLALLDLETADYLFVAQLGELRSNELRISIERPSKPGAAPRDEAATPAIKR